VQLQNVKGQKLARLVIVNRDITQRKRAEELLAQQRLFTDTLTNLTKSRPVVVAPP